MKIAYIYDVIYPYVKGGAEKRFWELARRLSAKGHEVHIFGMKSWKGEAYFIKEGVHVHGISRPKEMYLKTGIRNPWQVLYFTVFILPAIWKERFDIIDCNVFPYLPFFPVRFFSLFRRIPMVVTWQEVWDTYWYKYLGLFKGHLARFIERVVIRLSHNIIAHSLTTRQELVRCKVNESDIRMIPNGIDVETIDEIPASIQVYDVVFLGRLIRDKNADLLIKSISIVKSEFKEVKCFIIGSGPEKEALVSLSEELDLKDNIIFKDGMAHQEVVSYLKSCKVFVLPSTREGFGIVVLEAMACGLPVVTVNHPMNAAAELIRDNENGFLCGLSPEEIGEKITLLLRQEELRNRLSRAAFNSVKEYTWDRIARENEAFYKEVLKR